MTTTMTRPTHQAHQVTKERKVFSGYKVQVDADQGIVEAIVAVMGSVDEGRDRIMPGAFSKTIQERASKIRVLDQHNADSVMRVLGKPVALREMSRAELPAELLQQYPDATGGLYARTQFFLDTPEGKGAFLRLAQGGLDEWSIGYDALDVDYTTELKDGKQTRVRNLKTIRLWEVSPVLWGMNPATTTLSAKDAAASSGTPGKDGKEMVVYPNSTTVMEYPVQRLGDVLQGTIHRDFTRLTDTWYIQGMLSRDERIALSGAIGDALGLFNDAVPADVQMRQVYCASEMAMDCQPGYFMSAVLDLEAKAGRVLSASNTNDMTEAFAALGGALVNIQSIMKRAGLLEDPELEDPELEDPDANANEDNSTTPEGTTKSTDDAKDVDAKARRILEASQLASTMAESEPSKARAQASGANGVTTHQAVDEAALLQLIELEQQSTDLLLEETHHGAGT